MYPNLNMCSCLSFAILVAIKQKMVKLGILSQSAIPLPVCWDAKKKQEKIVLI